MWLLFYVMDSLSVKFLQEGKQAIQRQPFLHNANLPTSMPTDNHPFIRRYLTESSKLITRNATTPTTLPMDSPTHTPTDSSPSVSHREFEKNYNKIPPSPTGIPRELNPSVSHREFENIYNKMPQSATGILMDYSPSVYHRELENI